MRSHEVEWEGHFWYHRRKVLSLFSASNYHGELTNYGAFCVLDEALMPQIQQFKARPLGAQLEKLVGGQLHIATRLEQRVVAALTSVIARMKAQLNEAFGLCDTSLNGYVSRIDWAKVMLQATGLQLPWLSLLRLLTYREVNMFENQIGYVRFLESYRYVLGAQHCVEEVLQYVLTRILEVANTMAATPRARGVISKAFNMCDEDGNGIITYKELKHAVQQAIPDIPESVIYTLMRTLDQNQDNLITSQEFVQRFRPVFRGLATKGKAEEWIHSTLNAAGQQLYRRYSTPVRAFDALDVNEDGRLTYEDFARQLELLLNNSTESREESAPADGTETQGEYSLKRLSMLAAYVDNNGDGFIELAEFLQAFAVADLGPDHARQQLTEEIRSEVGLFIGHHRGPLRAAFHTFDSAGTGRITVEDFKIALECLNDIAGVGGALSEVQTLQLVGSAAEASDGCGIDYDTWLGTFEHNHGAALAPMC